MKISNSIFNEQFDRFNHSQDFKISVQEFTLSNNIVDIDIEYWSLILQISKVNVDVVFYTSTELFKKICNKIRKTSIVTV